MLLGFLAAEGGAAAWFRAALGRVLLGFLAAGGGATAWFRAALGRVMLGFLGSKVRVDRSVESIHVQNC